MTQEEKINIVCETLLKTSNCLRFQSRSSSGRTGNWNCIHCRAVVHDVEFPYTLVHEPGCPVTIARDLIGWIPSEGYNGRFIR